MYTKEFWNCRICQHIGIFKLIFFQASIPFSLFSHSLFNTRTVITTSACLYNLTSQLTSTNISMHRLLLVLLRFYQTIEYAQAPAHQPLVLALGTRDAIQLSTRQKVHRCRMQLIHLTRRQEYSVHTIIDQMHTIHALHLPVT